MYQTENSVPRSLEMGEELATTNPIALIIDWFNHAHELGVRDPKLMALATADADGFASNRIVRILRVTEGQLIFTSHTTSQKGREIAATGWGSAVAYWPETQQQLIVSGLIPPLAASVSDQLWNDRPNQIKAMSIVSEQSSILTQEEELRGRAQALLTSGVALERPTRWIAYGLIPRFIEFWRSSSDGLHRRIRYQSTSDGWQHLRLQP